MVSRNDFPEMSWYGNWIWLPLTDEEERALGGGNAGKELERPEVHALFRKVFRIERVPEKVPARISADSRYALYANGVEVSRGPARAQPYRLQYDFFDLAPFLTEGENVLSVYVKYYGVPRSIWMPALPDARLGATGMLVFEADLDDTGWVVSDDAWKSFKCDAWTPLPTYGSVARGLPVEVFDARKYPHGWKARDFNDSGWDNAAIISTTSLPAAHLQFCGITPREMAEAAVEAAYVSSSPPGYPYGPLYPRMLPRLGGEVRYPQSVSVEYLSEEDLDDTGDPVLQVLGSLLRHDPGEDTADVELPLTLTMPEKGYARIVMDMGSIVAGFVRFELNAPAGSILDLYYADDIRATGVFDAATMFAGTRHVADGERGEFEVFDPNGFRYAVAMVRGEGEAPILRSFSVRENLCPWGEGAYFACSDNELNRIYKAGIRTVALNSQDAILDCPTREQRSFPGDAVVPIMVHLVNNTDVRMVKQQLLLCNSPRPDGILPLSVAGDVESAAGMITIPDWSLHWIHSVHALYWFRGEEELVRELMPTIERVLRWYGAYQTSSGLLRNVPEWNLIDWGYIMTRDTSSTINALWARGLKDFAELAAGLGDFGRHKWAQLRYKEVKKGFEAFWDPSRGSYVDHLTGGERRKPMSQLAGALAICSSLAPEGRREDIVDVITDEGRLVSRSWMVNDTGMIDPRGIRAYLLGKSPPDWDVEMEIVRAEPFMQYTVHDAIAIAGKADMLPELYRRWSLAIDDGYDTIRETWTFGSHAHAWSCTPSRDVMVYTLGVRPAVPGFASACIAPRLGPLQWAKGAVPTPYGLLSVDVDGDSIHIDSPIPFTLEPEGGPVSLHTQGVHDIRF
ncbi:MAG: hypothetical protein C4536_02000 [Actinobacteria bacterium]|jgi:hypothetical protein|nr:MAG: hypothetical protein C4536_02000 [Actinomycetota bacterium]